jgi:DNA-binding transcriptional LysR family regulator
VSGTVSITAAPSFAFDLLAPFADALRKKHPEITLKIIFSMERLHLSRGEVDIALRLRKSTFDDPDLITLDEVKIPTGVYASKDYARSLPKKYDFHDVNWIAWADEYEMLSPNPELAAKIPKFRPVFTSDDYSVQVAACQAGVGAMVLLKTSHRLERPGELIELKLKAPPASSPPLAIICHKRLVDLPKVRIVANMLRQEFAKLREGLSL